MLKHPRVFSAWCTRAITAGLRLQHIDFRAHVLAHAHCHVQISPHETVPGVCCGAFGRRCCSSLHHERNKSRQPLHPLVIRGGLRFDAPPADASACGRRETERMLRGVAKLPASRAERLCRVRRTDTEAPLGGHADGAASFLYSTGLT